MTRRSLCSKFMPPFLENCGQFRRSGPGYFGAFGTFLMSLCLFLYYFIVSNFDNSTVLRCNFSGIKLEPPNYTLDYTLSFLSVRVSYCGQSWGSGENWLVPFCWASGCGLLGTQVLSKLLFRAEPEKPKAWTSGSLQRLAPWASSRGRTNLYCPSQFCTCCACRGSRCSRFPAPTW